MHKYSKVLSYPTSHIYQIVADVKSYPEFLPWLDKVIIQNEEGNFVADLFVKYKSFEAVYQSLVKLEENKITAHSGENEWLDRLVSIWNFEELEENKTKVDFALDVKFKSKIVALTFGTVFKKSAEVMIDAFEKRAKELQI